MRSRYLTAALAGLALLLSSCISPVGAADPGTLVWAVNSAPRSLDTAHGFDGNTIIVNNELLEPLVSVGSDGELIPRLAESWAQPDRVTYVYQLHDDVRFWDGSPLTAEDVAYSMQRHLDPEVASELASYAAGIKSVTATGPLEVTIKLTEPAPEFGFLVAMLSHTVQKEFAEKHADTLGDSSTLTMGSGPYEVEDFSSQGVVLRRNDDYWAGRPEMERLEINVISDAETLRLALAAGEVDGTFSVPIGKSRIWDTLDDVEVEYVDAPVMAMLTLDTAAAPWDDIHVRRAVAHAIDRESIVRALFNDRGRVADSIVDPLLWDPVLPDESEVDSIYDGLQTYDYDPEAAAAELALSEHPDGFTFDLPYPADSPYIGQTPQVIADNLSTIGITVNLREVPFDKWLGDIYAHQDLGAQILGISADYPDPSTMPTILLDPAGMAENGFNLANFTTPELEEALRQEGSADSEERVAALSEVMQIAGDELPYVPLYSVDAALAINDEFDYDAVYSYWVQYFQEWATNVRRAS